MDPGDKPQDDAEAYCIDRQALLTRARGLKRQLPADAVVALDGGALEKAIPVERHRRHRMQHPPIVPEHKLGRRPRMMVRWTLVDVVAHFFQERVALGV